MNTETLSGCWNTNGEKDYAENAWTRRCCIFRSDDCGGFPAEQNINCDPFQGVFPSTSVINSKKFVCPMDIVLVLLLSLIIGVAAGFISGLLGIGSGVILVPAVMLLMDRDFNQAKAAALATMVVMIPFGVHRHAKHGNVDRQLALRLGIFGAIGSMTGIFLSTIIPTNILKLIFALTQFAVAWRMIRTSRALVKKSDFRRYSPAVGFAGGMVAGLLGLGGGVIMVPAMNLCGIAIHTAVGTSLAVIVINASVSTVFNIFLGLVEPVVVLPLAAGAVFGMKYGVRKAISVNQQVLRRYFAVFLVFVGAYIILRSMGEFL